MKVFEYMEPVIAHHIIQLDEPIELSSGGSSTTYVDLREAAFCKKCRYAIECFIEGSILYDDEGDRYEDHVVVLIGSFGFAVADFARRVADRVNASVVVLTSQAHGIKWHGRISPHAAKAIVIDDVKTTGASLRRAHEAIEALGLSVVETRVIVDRLDE